MTTKVVLTKEQGKAIEEYLVEFNREKLVRGVSHPEYRGFTERYAALSELNLDTLIHALYVGYEIEEPEFKVEDWVTILTTSTVEKILDIEGTEIFLSRGIGSVHSLQIRHATPEEIFWAELGREVGEFKVGDTRVNFDNESIYVTDTTHSKQMYFNGHVKGFYPAESFKAFPKDGEQA